MRSRSDAYDIAIAERFLYTVERKGSAKHTITSRPDARLVTLQYTDGWYDAHRRHAVFKQGPPLAFERAHAITSEAVKDRNPAGSKKLGQVQFIA
jgi:transposase InsO family protein